MKAVYQNFYNKALENIIFFAASLFVVKPKFIIIYGVGFGNTGNSSEIAVDKVIIEMPCEAGIVFQVYRMFNIFWFGGEVYINEFYTFQQIRKKLFDIIRPGCFINGEMIFFFF